MMIRRAIQSDIPDINRLRRQVLMVHHSGRPDLFKANAKKYTDEQLAELLMEDTRPVFVAIGEAGDVLGYAFCILEQHIDHNVLTDIKTLYIDDLCVDETVRGQHIGRSLLDHVLEFARKSSCYNVTLNVWSCNANALKFYEKCGLKPQKIGMERIL